MNMRINNTLLLLLLFTCLMNSCTKEQRYEYYIGVSQCSKDSWRDKANKEILREVSSYNDVKVEIKSVADDSKAQIQDIESFIEQGVNLLIVSPNESSALTTVLDKAYKQGIPVLLYDRKTNSNSYTAYVGADNHQIGSQIGDYLMNNLVPSNGKCNLVIIRGTKGSTADLERYEGLISAFENKENGNRINVIATSYGNFIEDDAYREMTAIIDSLPAGQDINGVVTFNDRMAMGVYNAFLDSNRLEENDFPFITGVDALPGKGGVDEIINGKITASFIYPTGGDVVVDIANKILRGEPYEKNTILNTAAVDIFNARVVALQQSLIDSRQQKIDELNNLLDKNLSSLVNYKRNLTALILLMVMIFFIVVLLFVLYKMKSKMNNRLNQQNKKISSQVEELEQQKQQLIELSRQLEDATNAKLVFFTNISHEFKTPLTLILGPIKELMEKKDLDSSVRNLLVIINRNASRLYTLINEIIEFRTIENGKMKVHLTQNNLKSFLSDINESFSNIFARKRISFNFLTGDDDYNLPFDYKKIEKIYYNLLSNAVKYVKDDGTIRTSLELTHGQGQKSMIIRVYNSDSFISEDKLKEVFNRFYKIDDKVAGSGIGLALTNQLVSVMGGEIHAESTEGIGTTFVVKLPVMELDDSGQSLAESATKPDIAYTREQLSNGMKHGIDPGEAIDEASDKGKETVLVVEDNPDMIYFIKGILEAEYRVISARDGKEGVKKARDYSPDIIVSDIMMPEMDGFELCREIKADKKMWSIPVIMLTANGQDEQKALGYECGADGFMSKPFSSNVLKVRIRNLLDKSKEVNKIIGKDWLPGENREITRENAVLLAKVKDYVEAHLQETISVDEMISNMGMSKSNFYRKLKAVTDWSTVDIIQILRLKHAINLVIYKNANLSEAAFESGFNSLSYFSQTFVKFYQMPPREWIKKQMGK